MLLRRAAPHAGPLFNMLACMSLGFVSLFAKRHTSSEGVVLRPEVALGCCFLIGYNVIIAAVGLINKGELPRAWYALYFVLACITGLWAGM